MNKIKSLFVAALAALTLASCEDVLVDNVNPDSGHENTCELGLPVLVFYASQTVYDHSEYYIYLSQCLTTMGKSQTGSYAYKSGWQFLTMNRHPQWRRHFYDIGVNNKLLVENSKKINSPNFELIGRTIMLMSTQLTTDAFGDMPRSEAYLSNSPAYDTQESIYKWMFEECDELIKLYEDPAWTNNPQAHSITKKMDRVYAGDLSKWKGLVYAIKARLLLRNIPNVDCSVATCDSIINTAQKAIDTWSQGALMYGEFFGNEPRYNFDVNATGESAAHWSSAEPKINSWESRDNQLSSAVPSKFFVEDCLGVINPGDEMKQGYYDTENGYGSDPRLALLFKPNNGPISAANATKTRVMLRYLENNIGAGSTFKIANYPSLFCGAYAAGVDAYNCIFTMEELYFIQAEAYYWKGNKAKACELARTATEWNIKRHLARFQQDNPGCYPGKDGNPSAAKADADRWDRRWTAFFDNQQTKYCLPCTEIGNKHWFFNASDYTLYDLMTQKYIAMYMQPEQWTDMRRYHYSNNRNKYGIGDTKEIVYPTLRRPYNLYQAYWVDGLSEAEKENCWIQRLNYDPETEEKYNRAELERLGAYKNHEWLRKPMIWSQGQDVKSSLTAE